LWAILLNVCPFAMMDYVDILSERSIILLPFCVMVQNGNSFVLTWKQSVKAKRIYFSSNTTVVPPHGTFF
jgi:hypothetical protein